MGVNFSGGMSLYSGGGPLPIPLGGTGSTSAQSARNALLPTQTGSAGHALVTDGSNMYWANVTTPPGGDNLEVQFNDSGSFGGSAAFTINKTSGALTSTSILTNRGLYVSNTTATVKPLFFQTNGSHRWLLAADSTAESGGNTGSNFYISAYTDDGLSSNHVVTISRASQVVDFKQTPTINGVPVGYGAGTVLSVNGTGAQGVTVSGGPITVNGTLTVGLGNITPTSVAATGTVTGSNLSGTNTGDQTITLTGDVSGSGTGTFATALSATGVTAGTYTAATITVDAKGRVTSASSGPAGGVTSFNTRTGAVVLTSTDVTTALAYTPYNATNPAGYTTNTGTVTNVSVVTANGVSGSVATATTTPAITLSLGNITPTSVAATGTVTGSNLSGTNTGDQTITLTGDVSGSGTGTFATALSATGVTAGTYGSVTTAPVFTVDAKGRLSSVSTVTVTPAFSSVTGKPTTIAGYGITDAQPLNSNLTALAAGSTTGIQVRTGSATYTTRSVDVTGVGLAVSNADGVAGNPTITSNATANNIVNTLVSRDANGNFSAGTITATLTGNAATATLSAAATALQTARTISATGDATWSVSFNGTANATAALTLSNSGVTAGTYSSVTVDAKGRVTAGTTPVITISGDISGSGTTSITGTLATVNSAPQVDSFRKITVNSKGLVTATSAVTSEDITNIIGSSTVTNTTNTVNTGITNNISTSTAVYPTWVAGTTGYLPQQVSSTRLSFVPSTGVLSAVQFSGSGAGLTNIPNSALVGSGAVTVSAGTGLTGGGTIELGSLTTISMPPVGTPVSNQFVKITTDDRGRVAATTSVASSDVVSALGYTPVNRAGDTVSGTLTFSSGTVTGLATPTFGTDAATKNYVDSAVTGLSWKTSVRAATTANITLSGLQTIDGVALATGDRVLVKNQSTAAQNGIYTASTTLWARAEDANTPAELDGSAVYVKEGTTLADTGWTETATVVTVGTSPITYVQFSGAGAYAAGTGLSLTGNTFANTGVLSNIAGTGITVSSATGNITIGTANIPNSSLTNSSLTIGSTTISLGGTSTTLAGLTSVTSTGFTGALTGNASTATALQTARTISATGDATWSVSFNGTANATAALTLASVGTPVTNKLVKITTDAKGRVTATTDVVAADIPALPYASNSTGVFTGYIQAPQQKYTNAYTQTFYQSYVPTAYFVAGEYQEICTVTPVSDNQNFELSIEAYVQIASNVQVIKSVIGLRSNILPDLSYDGSYSELLIGGLVFAKPVVWMNETTGVFKIALMHLSNTVHNISLKMDVVNRGNYNNVVMNTVISSEVSTIPAGFVQYDITKISTEYNGEITFTGTSTATDFVSTVPTGTAPFTVASTTPVTNLNIGGNAATASQWATARTLTLSGDVTGSASITGASDITLATTIAPNSIVLGTDTTGDYVATAGVSGNGLSGTATGEGSTFTVTSNATDLNTANTIVYRNASGNFSAGTITAALSGNASTATTLQTARNINGVSFNGSADITVAAAAGTLTGSTLAAGVTASSLTSVGTLTNLTVTNPISGSVTGSSGSTTGNAATATTLQTARTINGVSFNGSANITVPAAAGTLTGATLASGVTASSLTSVGTLSGLTLGGTLLFNNATSPNTHTVQWGDNSGWKLRFMTNVSGTPTERFGFTDTGNFNAVGTISASNFSGSSSGTNTGDQTNITGNAGTATTLQTARTINGVSFNGSANITVPAAAGTLTGTTLASGVTASSLTSVGTLSSLTVGGAVNISSTTGSYLGDSSSKIWIGGSAGTNYIESGNAAWNASANLNITGYNGGVGGTVNMVFTTLQRNGNTVLDAGNYNSYSPTLTGGNASGTWGINITGNADTVDSLHVATGRNNLANQIVRTDASGYLQVGYINSSNGNEGNNSNPPRVWGTNGSDDYMRTYLTSALSVNYANSAGSASTATSASTAVNLSTTRANWSTNGTISAVVGQLAWKNYSNNHTIFDASAGTSPDGTAVNNTNAAVAWSGTYPTLMGWNGSSTYGVRVDSARVADTAGSIGWESVTGKPAGIMYYQGFTLDADTMDANATGFTYAVNAPYTGPIAKFAASNYDLWLNAPYQGGNALAFRTKNGDSSTLNPWKYILHDGNYNNYSPTLTGGNASGTWGINITGNSASTSSVAWTNVSGRPTAVSSFTNDSGYITSAGRAYPRRSDGGDLNFYWSGQSGQPTWLWGGTDGTNMYVYNPSNFSVNYATTSGSTSGNAATATTANSANSLNPGNGYQVYGLGVGTAPSGTAGEIRATNNITAYYSDDRLKTRTGNIENALEKIATLDTFYYHANETAQSLGYTPTPEVGISAQQVQAIMPEVVAPAPIDEKYLTVRYERLVPLLIAAIKELQEEILQLKAK